jgi:hypothetical protein
LEHVNRTPFESIFKICSWKYLKIASAHFLSFPACTLFNENKSYLPYTVIAFKMSKSESNNSDHQTLYHVYEEYIKKKAKIHHHLQHFNHWTHRPKIAQRTTFTVVTVVDQAQDKAGELEAAENHSETFESWDELAEITKNMHYNRNCT